MSEDIANKEIRPDVWVEAAPLVNPTAYWRSDKPPTKGLFEPYAGAAAQPDPLPGGAEKKKDEEDTKMANLVQTDAEFLGNPEGVLVLDPIAYQVRA